MYDGCAVFALWSRTCGRTVHEQLSSVVREAAEAAVGTESLLLVLGALQVRAASKGHPCCFQQHMGAAACCHNSCLLMAFLVASASLMPVHMTSFVFGSLEVRWPLLQWRRLRQQPVACCGLCSCAKLHCKQVQHCMACNTPPLCTPTNALALSCENLAYDLHPAVVWSFCCVHAGSCCRGCC